MTPDIIFNFATSGRSIAPITDATANRRGLVDLIHKMRAEFNNLVFFGTYWEDEVKEARASIECLSGEIDELVDALVVGRGQAIIGGIQ